jgi:membrane protein implicated in regulation of membrane protease activity
MASDPENPGIVKNIFTGYFILILHVLLLVLLGLFIIFFRGLVQYMPWILGGGLALLVSALIWVVVKFRRQRDRVQHMRSQGRGVEISLLGGLASMRVGGSPGNQAWEQNAPLQLEDPHTSRMRSMERLMEMYQQELISRDEFLRLKQDLLHAEDAPDSAECEEATIIDLNENTR